MKKTYSLGAVALLLTSFAFAACSSDPEQPDDDDDNVTRPPPAEGGSGNDDDSGDGSGGGTTIVDPDSYEDPWGRKACSGSPNSKQRVLGSTTSDEECWELQDKKIAGACYGVNNDQFFHQCSPTGSVRFKFDNAARIENWNPAQPKPPL